VHVERGLADGAAADPAVAPAVVTIGSFDGVHRGHLAVLARVRSAAAEIGAEAAVVTFDPHPRCVLRPHQCPPTLTTVHEKTALLAAAGIDRLVVLPFDHETSLWPAGHFLDRLRATLAVRRLVVGPDFALGHQRQGDVAFLRAWGAACGVAVEVIEPLADGGGRVSSTRVRDALAAGDVAEAARVLGRPHLLDAVLVDGEDPSGTAGRTAGLTIPDGKALPAPGVYACWARIEERWWMAATAISAASAGRPSVTATLLDFDGDTAGHRVRCSFVERAGDGPAGEEGGDLDPVRRILAAQPPPTDAG
jgi:riboflavin kinase/FMN adenylyltransferase